jgi:hypothetical protein
MKKHRHRFAEKIKVIDTFRIYDFYGAGDSVFAIHHCLSCLLSTNTSVIVASTQRAKNPPPEDFFNALSSPVSINKNKVRSCVPYFYGAGDRT